MTAPSHNPDSAGTAQSFEVGEEQGAWLDIASAPTNEYVLVFCPDTAEPYQIMICGLLEFEGDPDPAEWYELNADTRPKPLDVTPTYWQPLPPPPSACAARQGRGGQ